MPRTPSLLVLRLMIGSVLVFAASVSVSADQAADRLIGTWSGTYSGEASGKFTMVFSLDAAKKIGGTVQATADAGNGYTATFKSVVVDGKTVKLAYDDPETAGAEVQLEATLDGATMTGTWKSLDTGAKSVIASGTFTGSKR